MGQAAQHLPGVVRPGQVQYPIHVPISALGEDGLHPLGGEAQQIGYSDPDPLFPHIQAQHPGHAVSCSWM